MKKVWPVVLTLGASNTTPGLTTYKIVSSYPSAGSVVYATNTTAPNTNLTVPSTYVNPNGPSTFTYTVTSAPCASVSNSVTVIVHPVPVVTLTLGYTVGSTTIVALDNMLLLQPVNVLVATTV